MDVALHPHVEKFVEEKVRTGEFASAEEAVNQMLSHICEQDRASGEDIAELRDLVDAGIAELDSGEFAEFSADDIIAERRAAYEASNRGA